MSDGTLTAGHSAKPQPLLRLLSDERLVKLAAEGSTPAFTTIYERHHQAVYRYSRSILHSDHDARDVLQSTMLKAMEALSGESREIALRPWLFRIAHNESISQLRNRPTNAPIDGADEIAAVEADPEVRDRLRALIADLDQLSLRQRSALVMRELNGLEFEEIGLALEASPEAAKQAVYEARLALHELEEGREMTCDEVRRKISAEDRRLLRGRRVRGHLRSCESCAAFERSTRARSSQLACIAPPLPAAAALGILNSLFGGGTGGGGIAGLAGGSAAVGLGGSTLAKLGLAGVLAVGIGSAALENGDPSSVAAGASPSGELARPGSNGPAVGPAGGADRTRGSDDDASQAREQGRSEGRRNGAPGDSRGDGRGHGVTQGGTARSDESSPGGGGREANPPPSAGAQTAPGQVHAPSVGGGGGGGGGGASPDATLDREDGPPAGSDDASPPPEPTKPPKPPRGGGPTGVPPGHGGIPPGLGGVPPGLGAPPPGHGGPIPGHQDKDED